MEDGTAEDAPRLNNGYYPHRVIYKASNPDYPITIGSERWRPSIHMPKWAARIWLEITNIRVERLNDISDEDAGKEGVFPNGDNAKPHVKSFFLLWSRLNGAGSWEKNPWVWVIEFKRLETRLEGK
jgi:hypothetical protein